MLTQESFDLLMLYLDQLDDTEGCGVDQEDPACCCCYEAGAAKTAACVVICIWQKVPVPFLPFPPLPFWECMRVCTGSDLDKGKAETRKGQKLFV